MKAIESLLLSVGHFWSLRETADWQVDLLERHFRQDEMLAALKELAELTGLPKPKKRNPGAARSATKAQAEDVVMGSEYHSGAALCLPRVCSI